MSDSVTKWHEMQESKLQSATMEGTFIYESPDGGETVTIRPFNRDVKDRVVIKKPIISEGAKKDAYTILSVYSEESILEAARILIGS